LIIPAKKLITHATVGEPRYRVGRPGKVSVAMAICSLYRALSTTSLDHFASGFFRADQYISITPDGVGRPSSWSPFGSDNDQQQDRRRDQQYQIGVGRHWFPSGPD
jgi:hypothetical protein